MDNYIKPLGIRLAEKIGPEVNGTANLRELFDNMVYDPKDGINKIKVDNHWIPALTWGHGLGTQTVTKLETESTDRDYHQNNLEISLGTSTSTRVQRESTDQDSAFSQYLATITSTFVEEENTDKD